MSYYSSNRIVKESIPVLIIATFLGIIAGTILNSAISVTEFVALLLITPAFVNMGGDVGLIVAARVSTALHLHSKTTYKSMVVKESIGGAIIVGFIGFTMLGVFGETILLLISGSGIGYVRFIMITGIAGMLLTLFITITAAFLALSSTRFGIDPDNFSVPLTTTIGDVVGVGFLIIITRIILGT